MTRQITECISRKGGRTAVTLGELRRAPAFSDAIGRVETHYSFLFPLEGRGLFSGVGVRGGPFAAHRGSGVQACPCSLSLFCWVTLCPLRLPPATGAYGWLSTCTGPPAGTSLRLVLPEGGWCGGHIIPLSGRQEGGEMFKGVGFPAGLLLTQNCVVLPPEVHFEFPSFSERKLTSLTQLVCGLMRQPCRE